MPKKSKHNRWIINFFADIHCGSRLSICDPAQVLYSIGLTGNKEPWTPNLTPAQAELWDLYEGHIDKVMDFADGDPVALILVGDPTQGEKFKDELMVSDVPNQVAIASGVIEKWLAHPNVNYLRFATGTDVHEYGEASATRLLSEFLSMKYTKRDISWVHHGLLDVQGITIDYAHHGPGPGKRKYLEMNNATWYLRDIMFRELLKGKTPPHLVVRAHQHNFGITGHTMVIGDRLVSSDLIVIPAYQTLNGHARKVGQSAYEIYHGMIAVEVIDGDIGRVMPYVKMYDLRRRESVG